MGGRRVGHAWRIASILVVALLIGAGGWYGPASAEDAPLPPPLPAPLEKLFLPLKAEMAKANLPPFLRDTDLKAHFRIFYFGREKPDDTENEALAFGGWLGYRSGLLLDTFSMGATIYGSTPLYALDSRDGTLLLKPGQHGYYVPGEAWGALQYKDYAVLKGYRQLVDQTYINPQDNRMTPNTFEGVTLGGKVGWVQYLGGFLWQIKPRNEDEFISLSEQAGVAGNDYGAGLAGVRLTPVKGLRIDVSNQYGVNTFNTVYGEVDYLRALDENWKLRLGAQFTDQRATADALLTSANQRFWNTQHGGGRVQVTYRELTLTGAFSITGSGHTIQSPWGSFPGYISLMDQDFNRASERAALFGVAYDFAKVATGLSAFSNMAWGWDAINPKTRATAPNQAEYDITVDYRPPWLKPGFLKGLWFRLRGAILDQEDARRLGYQLRFTINSERDLL
jgi:hypothetical protein